AAGRKLWNCPIPLTPARTRGRPMSTDNTSNTPPAAAPTAPTPPKPARNTAGLIALVALGIALLTAGYVVYRDPPWGRLAKYNFSNPEQALRSEVRME